MKFQLFAFVLVVAGAYAMPPASDAVVVDQPAQRIIIEGQIRNIIQQISDAIRGLGLDPLEIENEEFEFVSEEFLVDVKGFIDSFSFVGASNIHIHSLDYNLIFNRLRFDISLPQISVSLRDSGLEGSISDNEIKVQAKGSFIIESIRLSGEVSVNISVVSGISLRSISLNFSVGDIRADVSVIAQEIDFSETLNILLNESIPNALEEYSSSINRLLENLVKEIFDRLSF